MRGGEAERQSERHVRDAERELREHERCRSGRPRVRRIRASIFCSTKQLTAAAAPATSAMPIVASRSSRGGTMLGVARNMPITAVKTISETTRGLVSA